LLGRGHQDIRIEDDAHPLFPSADMLHGLIDGGIELGCGNVFQVGRGLIEDLAHAVQGGPPHGWRWGRVRSEDHDGHFFLIPQSPAQKVLDGLTGARTEVFGFPYGDVWHWNSWVRRRFQLSELILRP
jgi:hypothetical protein